MAHGRHYTREKFHARLFILVCLPGSGKRLRPALALLTGRLGTYDAERLLHMATGVELLHGASLVHDDVVDESDLRRGSQTLFTRVAGALSRVRDDPPDETPRPLLNAATAASLIVTPPTLRATLAGFVV